jgi:hypothetical protein
VLIGCIVIAGWQLSGICCGSQKYTFLISESEDPGVLIEFSRRTLSAVITFSISKKRKKERRNYLILLYVFLRFSQIK